MSTGAAMTGSLGDQFAGIATSGSLVLAIPIALAAGMVSFFSPCMLPLVPGYLSYVTGLAGQDLGPPRLRVAAARPATAAGSDVPPADSTSPPAASAASQRVERSGAARGRVLAGSVLFVAGFTAVFVSTGSLFGGLGGLLFTHAELLQRILGVVVILMGVTFLGWLPALHRQFRLPWRPRGGLASAPLLGAVFALGWTPCIGPTLAAVLSLAAGSGTAGRGALLAAAYSLGLGVPFIAVGLGMRRSLAAVGLVRRHQRAVVHIGGALLLITGVLLVSGIWTALMVQLRVWVSAVTLPI